MNPVSSHALSALAQVSAVPAHDPVTEDLHEHPEQCGDRCITFETALAMLGDSGELSRRIAAEGIAQR